MSQENMEWLRTHILIGFADRRGKAWWARRVDGPAPNHYAGAIPLSDVVDRLFGWKADELDVAKGVPVPVDEATDVDSRGRAIRWVREEDRKAIAADDNYDTLGHFKSGYQPHQYQEWLLNNVSTLLDGELSISSAGLLRNRAVAWVEVSVPDNIETPEGVTFRPNLLAATSMDGSLATTYKRTITAVVCDNTLSAALGAAGNQVKYKHSRNSISRIADARAALDIVYTTADDFAAEVSALTSQPISAQQWSKVLDEMVPIDRDGSKRGIGMAQTKRERLTQLYRFDERVAPWMGTAFGVLQAFNTYEHHLKGTKGDTIRAERNMMAALDGTTEASDRQVLAVLSGASLAPALPAPGLS